MSSLGEMLKRTRMEKGISIEELQETTKIRRRYIEAIEEDQLDALPGTFYARAFVKNIAEVLGLNPHQVLSQYESQLPKSDPQVQETVRPRRQRTKLPSATAGRWLTRSIGWLFILLMLSLGYYLIVQSVSDSSPPEDSIEGGVNSEAGEDTAQPPPPPPKPPPAPTPPPVEVVYKQSGKVKKYAADFYTVNNAKELVITLKATADCWFSLQKKDANGAVIESLTLKAGQSRTWNLQEGVWLLLGNPRGVELTVNGYPIPTSELTKPQGYIIEWVAPQGD